MSSLFGIGGGGNVGAAGGSFYDYEIENSLRMSDAGNTTLQWTAGTPSSSTTWTMSFWIKRWNQSTNQGVNEFFSAGTSGSAYSFFSFVNHYITHQTELPGARNKNWTNQLWRDSSAWYHFVFRANLNEGTQANRLRMYVNGVEYTATSDGITQSTWAFINASGVSQNWGGKTGIANGNPGCDHYLADINFCDGQSYAPTEFAETKNGIWVAKDTSGLTFGNNGYRLEFKQTGTGQNASGIGADTSGNGNHFAVSGLAAGDVVPDSPTNNFCTWNVLQPAGAASGVMTLSEGNMKATGGSSIYRQVMGNMSVLSGKWYTELYITDAGYPSWTFGWTKAHRYEAYTGAGTESTHHASIGYFTGSNLYITDFGSASVATRTLSYSSNGSPTTGSIIGCAADFDNGKLWWSVNGTWVDIGSGAGDPANGTNAASTFTVSTYADDFKTPHFLNYNGSAVLNTGQDSTFAGNTTAGGNSDENGVGDFKYSVPSGFLALASSSLPEPAIGPNSDTQADDYFKTMLWSGNSTNNRSITTDHATDLIWIKKRGTTAQTHVLADSVRGTSDNGGTGNVGILAPNDIVGVSTNSSDSGIASFDSTGFTIGAGSNTANADAPYQGTNASGHTYVGWSWKAGGTAVSNSEGSQTCNVSANTDAGFSIVSWTASSATGTVGHGLDSAPEMILAKPLASGTNWYVMHTPGGVVPATNILNLDSTADDFNPGNNHYNDTYPTDTVFSYGGYLGNALSNDDKVAYCFHSVEGFSKVGSFKGNSSASNGPFVYTGFRPSFVMGKAIGQTGRWWMYDSARTTYNDGGVNNGRRLEANSSSAESTSDSSNMVEFYSNGFKVNTTNGEWNGSGLNYIYIAFAEVPFKYANAR